jgi:hypothetical protein
MYSGKSDCLGVVLAEEFRRLGRTLRKAGFLKDRRTSGSEVKLCQPASSQSKIAQTRSLSFGSRKTCAPLQPCCFRFSAPFVEKVFQKRSKSSIFAVARTIVSSSVGACCCAVYPTAPRGHARPCSFRVEREDGRNRERGNRGQPGTALSGIGVDSPPAESGGWRAGSRAPASLCGRFGGGTVSVALTGGASAHAARRPRLPGPKFPLPMIAIFRSWGLSSQPLFVRMRMTGSRQWRSK